AAPEPAAWLRDPVDGDPGVSVRAEARAAGLDRFDALLYEQFHATALPTVLRTFDRCSMAHGVEIRMPFLDWRVVCYAFSLPAASKLGGGYTKRLVREAMRGVVPDAVRLRRQKVGFNAPLAMWFGGPLRDWLWDRVNEPGFLDADVWDGRAIRTFVEQRRASNVWSWSDAERVWPFVHAQLWRTHFLGKR
ncbi:MAG: asparagine synthase-related protein, partial [Vulcanimicrobiaceae bacterium]